ncbi:MAG: hypothetical protein JW395_3256 [Nitrospira sp.]|nr:hypothetical protein [Nitrospira sp.]
MLHGLQHRTELRRHPLDILLHMALHRRQLRTVRNLIDRRHPLLSQLSDHLLRSRQVMNPPGWFVFGAMFPEGAIVGCMTMPIRLNLRGLGLKQHAAHRGQPLGHCNPSLRHRLGQVLNRK